MRTAARTTLLGLALGCSFATFASAAEPVEPDLFTTKVRPALARYCFKCHGPDDKTRKAGLRLDLQESATKPTKSGATAVVPGKPDESELLVRLLSDDPTEVMPPPSSKVVVPEADKEAIRRWIASGGGYRSHWAYAPPRQAEPPKVSRPEWVKNPIDAFVLARLDREGLKPSGPADRPTLLRRLSLDLIGLPPTPAELDAFLGDSSSNAVEKAVDRLLASPHYGERWARKWLDLARYADTNGYEKDRARSVWPYRDWVIDALNKDVPFDRFTIEQIAGDMLPGATPSQKIATGFHRNTMLNEEGGIDPLEFRYYAMTDRVATTATTWLGLTLGCAQCHTHKYDPIPHREYYSFMALMDNADEPEMQVPSKEVARKRREIESKIAAKIDELPRDFPGGDAKLQAALKAWADQAARDAVRWTTVEPIKAGSNVPLLTHEGAGVIFVSGDQTKRDVYTLEYPAPLKKITAIRLEALPDDRLPRGGPGRVYYEGPAGDFFLSEISASSGGRNVPLKIGMPEEPEPKPDPKDTVSKGDAKKKKPPVNIKAAFPTTTTLDGDPQTGWTINGGQGKRHVAIYHLAQPLENASTIEIQLLFERYHAANLGKFRISVTDDARPVLRGDLPQAVEAALLLPKEKRSSEQDREILRHFLTVAPELAKFREAIDALRKQVPAFPTALVMHERPANNPRKTFVHNRGEWLQPTDPVNPAVFGFLPGLAKDEPPTRLALAKWLVSRENPLTARVVMNRQWTAFFGRGIVRTTEDFGYQGEAPTHPELLDWLAVEFMNRGWSVKAMHKLIVTSSTYQQASDVASALLARDAGNILLARGPRVRLDAEQVRDQALRVSGLLSEKIGGPSVFPPQPPGVSTEGSYGGVSWTVSQGEDRYRRGLYTFSKRTAPYAMFTTFDGPSGEFCLARREVSNTPLQALTLLNDTVFQEAAQALGKLTASREGTVDERIAGLVRRCLSREPGRDELRLLERFYQAQRDRLVRKEIDAAAIAGPGPGDAVERAAWTILARAILNLDEMVTKG